MINNPRTSFFIFSILGLILFIKVDNQTLVVLFTFLLIFSIAISVAIPSYEEDELKLKKKRIKEEEDRKLKERVRVMKEYGTLLEILKRHRDDQRKMFDILIEYHKHDDYEKFVSYLKDLIPEFDYYEYYRVFNFRYSRTSDHFRNNRSEQQEYYYRAEEQEEYDNNSSGQSNKEEFQVEYIKLPKELEKYRRELVEIEKSSKDLKDFRRKFSKKYHTGSEINPNKENELIFKIVWQQLDANNWD